MAYRSLQADAIVRTASQLRNRVEERFGHRGIAKVCAEVEAVALDAKAKAEWISTPIWPLRVGVGLLIFIIVTAGVAALFVLDRPNGNFTIVDFLATLEAAINDLVLIGAALFFLVTAEDRMKRTRALSTMRELRALAHVIDMHQLTKDPERLRADWLSTTSSPVEGLTRFELFRYLDYCSEMLSILGKIAALYVQSIDDSDVLAAVEEIEELTTSLSGKIWQKIVVLRSNEDNPTDLFADN